MTEKYEQNERNMQNATKEFSAISKLAVTLGENLRRHIKGQTHAIYAIEESLFEAFTIKQTNNKGPLISILMTGLPGVGKTELVEQTAKYLGAPYLRVNMSSYSDKEASVFNFQGINESYRTSKPGDVTKFVNEHPDAIILFDEVDKAHQNVLNLLYQILEGGELEDACLRKKISFKNTIVFLTTNVGADLFQDLDRYNYATLSEAKIVNALNTEKNIATGERCFTPALVSRFVKGKIIPFNRLNGQILCNIATEKAGEIFNAFKTRYPNVELECDGTKLAKTLLLEKGCYADARGISAGVEHFLGTHLFDAMLKYEENGEDFSKLSKVKFSFNFFDGEDRAKNMFEEETRYKVAVYCDEEEFKEFENCNDLGFDFITTDEKVTSLSHDCALISVDLERNERALETFRSLKKQEDLPVYVFTFGKKVDRIDMKTYYCEGAEGAYIAKDGEVFEKWLGDIQKTVQFSKILSDLARANLVLCYDTISDYDFDEGQAVLHVKTFNYRLEKAVHTQDEGALVAEHEIPNVKFTDIKGLDSIVEEVKEAIKFIKDYKKYRRAGVKNSNGMLFWGPSGTGKTLLAKAIAAESGMPIIQRNATDYIRPYAGEGVLALEKDFSIARKYAPSVLFIDEVDAIAKKRGRLHALEASENVLNKFLTEMNGFVGNEKKPVFVIVATNFEPNDDANGLDPAFLRRFDRRIKVNLPNSKSRMELLQYYLGKHNITFPELQLTNFVQRSPGRSPAELEQIVEFAVRQTIGRRLEIEDLEEAFETISYGSKKEWSVETVRKTSYHEAGHALVAWLTGNSPAYVTNIARGSHGGYMQYESEEDKMDYTKQEVLDKICVSFAGRVAEQLKYGEKGITTGASSDLKQARSLACALVDEYAMDDSFLLGIANARSETAKKVFDEKVENVLKEQLFRATKMIKQNQSVLELFTEKLMAENSLNTCQIEEIFASLAVKNGMDT